MYGEENPLHESSAAPHLSRFPKVHSSLRGIANHDNQPPPYQVEEVNRIEFCRPKLFLQLSVTQLDETEEARRLELEKDVEELRRRREEVGDWGFGG